MVARRAGWPGCVLLCGCIFDSSGLSSGQLTEARPGVDRAPSDTQAEALSDRPSEGLLPDGLAHDQPRLDQPKLDKPVPADTKKLLDQKPLPSCVAKYGSVGISSFAFCSDTTSTCVFYFSASPSTASCDTVCAKGGGSCIKGSDDSNNGCEVSADEACTVAMGDGVCTCSR